MHSRNDEASRRTSVGIGHLGSAAVVCLASTIPKDAV